MHSHYSPEFIEARKADLLTLKQELMNQLDGISGWDEELGRYVATQPDFESGSSEDSGDAGQEAEDFQERNSQVEDVNKTLDEVNSALARMEDGTYGKCQTGGEYLDEDRLEAYPAASDCAAHQTA